MNVRMSLTKMFAHREPYDCSNNQATLGDQCARLTWQCALEVAERHEDWLVATVEDAVDYIKQWAREAGAWDRDEVEAWGTVEALALLVQNVASDLRELGSDECELAECVYTEDSEGASGSVSLWVWTEPGREGEDTQVFGEVLN